MKTQLRFFIAITMMLFFGGSAWGQTTTIDFETAGNGYTPSSTSGSGSTDVFNRVNPNIGGNSTYIWAAEDISGDESITLDQIDITGASSFSFSIDFLTPNTNDWDSTDELLITYKIDGGVNQNLMWAQAGGDDDYNEPAMLDLDFNGVGDDGQELPAITDDHSTGVGNNFETFSTSSISVSGSTLDITLQFNSLTSNDEGIYIDNIVITQTGSGSTPTISINQTSLTGFTYVEGNGPSDEQSFDVEGSNLTDDISIDAPDNYEISTGTGGSFVATNPITLTQTGGSVTSTPIYVRLKAGLSTGTYNSEVITCSSTGASDQTVTCDGEVTDGSGGGTEDFANFPETGTSYNDGTFTGQDGSTWTYTQCAGASSGNINPPTPYFGKGKGAEIYSGSISGGIGTVSFDYKQVFSTNVNLNILVNDNVVGTVTTNNQSGEILNSGNINVNVSGDFVLKFDQVNASAGQVAIDNVTWTGYSGGGNTPPSISNITQTPASGITSSTTVSVSADVTDDSKSVSSVKLKWGTSTGTYPNEINMSSTTGDTYETDSDIPAQSDGTTVYYVVEATDDESETTTSSEHDYTVMDPASIPFSEVFASDTWPIGWTYEDFTIENSSNAGGSAYETELTYQNDNPGTSHFTTKPINTSGETILTLSWKQSVDFYEGGSGDDFDVKVQTSTDGTTFSNDVFTQAVTADETGTKQVTLESADGVGSGTLYIRWLYFENDNRFTAWHVDDISLTTADVANPGSFSATTAGTTQIDLSFTTNGDGDHVVIVYDTDGSFDDPSGAPASPGIPFAGGTVVYNGTTSPQNHTGLSAGQTYYYKAWSYNGSNYSPGLEDNATTLSEEPSNHPSGFSATANSSSQITVSWTDATGGTLPEAYLVKAAVGPATPSAPSDGTPESDGTLVKNVLQGVGEAVFTGLAASTTYNFAIWPYTNSGSNIDYKTDGDVPTTDATTQDPPEVPVLVITEIMQNPSAVNDDSGEWFEIYNAGDSEANIDGFIIKDAGSDSHTIDNGGTLSIAAGSYLVLGNNSESATNGGVTVDYEYSGITLANGADEIIIETGDGTEIDRVEYDGGTVWPDPTGASMTLNPNEFSNNNIGSNWYEATSTYGDGDKGTPGAENDYPQTNWQGGTSSNWSDAGNWDNGVPDATTDAIIPSGKADVFIGSEETADCNNLTVEGTLTIQSDATGTGSLIINGTATGDVNVNRYLAQENEWHFISSSVDLSASNFDAAFGANDPTEFFRWDEDFEDQGLTGWWIDIRNSAEWTSNTFEGGKGYMMSYWTPTKENTYTLTGTPNVAQQNVTLTWTEASSATGWNLLGNPFTSTIAANSNAQATDNLISINSAILDDTYGGIYLYSETGGYDSKTQASAATFIDVSQGFMVKTNTDNSSFSITKAARKHGDATFYKNGKDEAERLYITLSNHFGISDKTEIVFLNGMTSGLDPMYDGGKLMNDHGLSVYSLMETEPGIPFAIQALPLLQDETNLKVGLESEGTGEMVFTVNNTESFNETTSVLLHDKVAGETINLRETSSYAFNLYTSGTIEDRFEITFKSTVGISEPVSADHISIFARDNQLFINSEEPAKAEIEIFNITGQLTFAKSLTLNSHHVISPQLTSGWYVVKVTTNQGTVSSKVFIK